MSKLSKVSIAQTFVLSWFRLLFRTRTSTIIIAIDSKCFVPKFVLQRQHSNNSQPKENKTTTNEEKLHIPYHNELGHDSYTFTLLGGR